MLAAESVVSVFADYTAFIRGGSGRGLKEAAVDSDRRRCVEAMVFDDPYRPDYVGGIALLNTRRILNRMMDYPWPGRYAIATRQSFKIAGAVFNCMMHGCGGLCPVGHCIELRQLADGVMDRLSGYEDLPG